MAFRIPLLKMMRRLVVPPYGSESATAHVAHGDAARARKDWPAATAAYRAAIEDQPQLFVIWIQLGHALKEQGSLDGAIDAYARASRLRPDDAEPHIFLAHIAKRISRYDLAITHFLQAHHAGNLPQQESDELLWVITHYREADRMALVDLLRKEIGQLPAQKTEAPLLSQLRAILTEDLPSAGVSADDRPTLVFDISDLISYYSNARLPTGIQRVQIETIEGALQRTADHAIRLCCFIDGRDEWLELPLEQMRALARLSTAGGDRFDPAWVEAIARLRIFLSLTPSFEFPHGATLINLGTSWWLQNYFLFVRHAKATRGIRYIPFVHDLIPIMAPEHCTRALTQDFISWVIGVFDHADHFLVNSSATKADLLKVAELLGRDLDPEDVAVVPLDTDFRKPDIAALPASALDKWSLAEEGFVLFVSTIESRKGHLVAFDAWSELIRRHGVDRVPPLVCVGNRGWLNSEIYARLTENPALAERVTMLSRLSDEELALLYRSCQFTLYPSLYEGWGLPVTESLCYGKVPLTSDAASLPQAGGDFAAYAIAGSVTSLVEAAEKLILDADHRAALAARIVAEFKPRQWSDLALQISAELDRFAVRDGAREIARPLPQVNLGSWHALSRNEATRIWRGMKTAEIFRSNLGWYPPEQRGSRVAADGGELTLGLPAGHRPLRLYVNLTGGDHGLARWRLLCAGGAIEGEVPEGESGWATCDLSASDTAHQLIVRLEARAADDGVITTCFVQGFFLCELDDAPARMDFVEAVALNRLDSIGAYREN